MSITSKMIGQNQDVGGPQRFDRRRVSGIRPCPIKVKSNMSAIPHQAATALGSVHSTARYLSAKMAVIHLLGDQSRWIRDRVLNGTTPIITCLALVLSLIVGCSGSKVVQLDPPQPNPTLGGELADTMESNVVVPVTISLAAMQAEANAAIPIHFAERRGHELTRLLLEDWIEWDVTRQAFALTPQGDRLAVSVPVGGRLSGGGQFRPIPIGRGIGVRESVNFNGTVSGSFAIQPQPDWSIRTAPQVSLSLAQADLKLVGNHIDVSVRGVLQDLFNQQAPAHAQGAAERAVAFLRLRERAEHAWRDLHTPRRLSQSPASWLVLEPQGISVRPVAFSGTSADTALMLKCRSRVVIAAEVPQLKIIPALPGLTIDPNVSGEFRLVVPVQTSLSEVSSALQRALGGKKLTVTPGVEVTFTSVSVGTAGDLTVVTLHVDAVKTNTPRIRAKGTLYLTGHIHLDSKRDELRIDDLDFDIATKNVLVAAAEWLYKPEVVALARKNAHTPVRASLGPWATKAEIFVNALGAETSPARFTIKDVKADLLDVQVLRGEAFALFSATGNAKLDVVP